MDAAGSFKSIFNQCSGYNTKAKIFAKTEFLAILARSTTLPKNSEIKPVWEGLQHKHHRALQREENVRNTGLYSVTVFIWTGVYLEPRLYLAECFQALEFIQNGAVYSQALVLIYLNPVLIRGMVLIYWMEK